MSQLIDGRIPAHTPCPFRVACIDGEASLCLHKGLEHTVPFSCGFARAFDLSEKRNSVEPAND